MIGFKLATCTVVISSVFAPLAHACRVFQTPEKRIAQAYAEDAELRVSLVTVIGSRHLTNPIIQMLQQRNRDFEAPWRAVASVDQVIGGNGSPELISFDRGWGPAACDDETPMPKQGDQWFVYYTQDNPIAAAKVKLSYPRGSATQDDPRLRGKVR